MCFLGCIFNSIEWNFLKIYTLQSPRKRYKQCKYDSDRSIMDTLLEEQCAFLTLSSLPLEGFLCVFSPHTLHACAMNGASFLAICQ
jgi:hypothetical protein